MNNHGAVEEYLSNLSQAEKKVALHYLLAKSAYAGELLADLSNLQEVAKEKKSACITNEMVSTVQEWVNSQEGQKSLAESMELARKQSTMIEAMSEVEEDMVRVPFTPRLD